MPAKITSYQQLKSFFIPAEKTKARIPFGNPLNLPTFEDAKIVAFGIPFDDTATFGKGAALGPEGMRHVSGRQIETYVVDENIDIYEKVPIFDLGDFKIKLRMTDKEREVLQDESLPANRKKNAVTKLAKVMKQFDVLIEIVKFLRSQGKIPLLLGGEHTISFWSLLALADENPVVFHFDAHRDAKDEYMNMGVCHTTWVYNAVTEADKKPPLDIVQIGIRQTAKDENEYAKGIGTTFYPSDIKNDIENVKTWIREKTKNRDVYISFDIDVLDIPYTPCTGTPEPFGLTPENVVELFKAIDDSAKLIGVDMTEVAVKNNDYKECTTAVQLLLRLFARKYVA